MVLFSLAFVAIIFPFFLLVNVASGYLDALGIVLAFLVLLTVTALAMTVAGRISRQRIEERYARPVDRRHVKSSGPLE